MALVIEDGTGVAGATSYVTDAAAQALALLYGITLPVDAEIALRQGYLNLNTHELKLQGERLFKIQTGIFPRLDVYAFGFLITSETVPSDIILAQIYAASAIAGGVDTNAVNTGQDLKSFDVKGVYSEQYQDNARIRVNSRIQGVYNTLLPYYQLSYNGGLTSFRECENIV